MSSTFDQRGQNVQTQYNAETMQIGATTPLSEMSQNITALKAEISLLTGIPDSVRHDVIEALDLASGQHPSPKNTGLKARLDEAGAALSTIDGITAKVLTIAQALFKIGKWIVAAL